MKILIPILGFARQGGYRVLSELANAWTRLGHECDFLVPVTSGPPYFPTQARVRYCDRSGLRDAPVQGRKGKGVDNVLSLWAGLSACGSEYDVVLANHCLTAWPVKFANYSNPKKFYYIQAFEPDYYPFRKAPIKHIMAHLSYFFGLKQIANANTYSKSSVKPLAVIPPGIDLSVFYQKSESQSWDCKDDIILGTIGRSEPYKGTATALAAYRHVKQSDSRLQMHVAFGNVEKSDDIKIIEIKNDVELADFYRSVDVLIVSCYSQHGAPHYPLIEAMACGTPVVQTGYFPGNEANTWYAKEPTIESVATALQALLNSDESERLKRVSLARDEVAQNLGWDQVALKFIRQFQD